MPTESGKKSTNVSPKRIIKTFLVRNILVIRSGETWVDFFANSVSIYSSFYLVY